MRRRRKTADAPTDETTTFVVTIVRDGPPYIEVGAYTYTGNALPGDGDTITVTSAVTPWGQRPHQLRARVTRVDPKAETPITATETRG
jgi:hypothetical protein